MDVIAWYKVPGIPDTAQILGGQNAAICESTFDELQWRHRLGPAFCTEAAWVSDNPVYDADADLPERLKNVEVAVGPAC
ncbi:hypothetical protein [Streptomyces sp. NPDC005548]|uniref:hypothetical protein n=1 Tax=Streptomyces sp. NPDC005548 TaxID=3364724 RepID=UPI003675C150